VNKAPDVNWYKVHTRDFTSATTKASQTTAHVWLIADENSLRRSHYLVNIPAQKGHRKRSQHNVWVGLKPSGILIATCDCEWCKYKCKACVHVALGLEYHDWRVEEGLIEYYQ
jgi:hypothetical protein